MRNETMRWPGSSHDRPGPKPTPAVALPSALVTRVLLACIVVIVAVQAARFAGLTSLIEKRTIPDFEVFHIVSQMIGSGQLDRAYRAATMFPIERQFSGTDEYLPWTYPPPFDLVVAPLGLLPLWLAYLLFTSSTLVLYFGVLRRLAGDCFGAVLLAIFPVLFVTIGCGQNGFLTGGLVGLACIGLVGSDRAKGSWAGLPLGMMVVKPHLAVCLGLYVLASRRWAVAAIAAAVVVLLAGLSTLAFGTSVWTAFMDGVAESRGFLERGLYPLHRMISVYAALRTFGASASVAMVAQAVVAMLAVASVWVAVRGLLLRQALGISAFTTLLVSPYAYDYDLPIAGIGLALVIPDLLRLTTKNERIALIGLSWWACGWGLAQTLATDGVASSSALPTGVTPLSLGGVALLVLTACVCMVLRRDRRPALAAPRAFGDTRLAA